MQCFWRNEPNMKTTWKRRHVSAYRFANISAYSRRLIDVGQTWKKYKEDVTREETSFSRPKRHFNKLFRAAFHYAPKT